MAILKQFDVILGNNETIKTLTQDPLRYMLVLRFHGRQWQLTSRRSRGNEIGCHGFGVSLHGNEL